jgi:hypothetical protein
MSERPSAQERYDREIASAHGGLGGYSSEGETVWRADSPAEQGFQDGFELAEAMQPDSDFGAAQEPAYEPEGYDPYAYEAEPDELDFGEPGLLGDYEEPTLEDTVRSAIREELGTDLDFSEHDAWAAERAQQQAEIENTQLQEATRQALQEGVSQAYHGRDLGEYNDAIVAGSAGVLAQVYQEFAEQARLNGQTLNEQDFWDALPVLAPAAVQVNQHLRSIEDMKRQVRAHYGVDR